MEERIEEIKDLLKKRFELDEKTAQFVIDNSKLKDFPPSEAYFYFRSVSWWADYTMDLFERPTLVALRDRFLKRVVRSLETEHDLTLQEAWRLVDEYKLSDKFSKEPNVWNRVFPEGAAEEIWNSRQENGIYPKK